MGLFDNLNNAINTLRKAENAADNLKKTVKQINVKSKKITFSALPETLEDFQALPQAALSTPFDTAAMTVVALSCYPKDAELCYSMLKFLKGPSELTITEKQFIQDRMAYQDFVPRSYFKGASPENDYTPSVPYTVTVSENPYSYDNEGYAKLYIASGGADSSRPITLRKAKTGKWYLWEQFLLAGVRELESENPWA